MISKLDDKDWVILNHLQRNARLSLTELSRMAGLSAPTVSDRIAKMEQEEVLTGYQASVSYIKAGYQLKAMVMLRVFMGKLPPFLEVVKSFQEVLNCYRITGNENIIMEVVLEDQFHLERFIDKMIKYGETRTHIILSEVVSNAPIQPKNKAR